MPIRRVLSPRLPKRISDSVDSASPAPAATVACVLPLDVYQKPDIPLYETEVCLEKAKERSGHSRIPAIDS
jgi:hypothetical protein